MVYTFSMNQNNSIEFSLNDNEITPEQTLESVEKRLKEIEIEFADVIAKRKELRSMTSTSDIEIQLFRIQKKYEALIQEETSLLVTQGELRKTAKNIPVINDLYTGGNTKKDIGQSQI